MTTIKLSAPAIARWPARGVGALLGAILYVTFVAHPALAGEGFLGIDHELALDQNGIWARKYQIGLEASVIATEVAGALWFGSDSQLGKTYWQAIDSSILSAAAASLLKRGFGRARPSQGDDPNRWFKGSCCESFPSGEVTLQASVVTPFIAEYSGDHPWVWALELLPAYDAWARMKSQAHWQTDVLAGWALGSALGYWSARRDVPWSVSILPRGLTIGLSRRF